MKYIIEDILGVMTLVLGVVIVVGCVIALLAIFPVLLLFVAIGFGAWLIDLAR